MRRDRLLVVADDGDAAAHALRDRAEPGRVVVTTPRDLSRAGWRFRPDHPDETRLVAGGVVMPAVEIGCVLTRLPAITEADLPHIVAKDRAYVAAEMTAFLLALLASLGPRVVNRPTPQCLCGPHGTDAAWRRIATALGLSAAPLRLCIAPGVDPEPDRAGHPVAVIGGAAHDAVDARQAAAAVALARYAGADLLTVAFDLDDPSAVLRAQPIIDLSEAALADAVAAFCDDVTAAA